MDTNVDFQALNHNFEKKIRGVFVKLPGAGDFWNYSNYFSKENLVE
jgi:hypothetical protein